MKTILISALAFVSLMTACHSTDGVAPRPVTHSPMTTSAGDTTQYRVDVRTTDTPATVSQFGTPGAAVQPEGRSSSVGNLPAGNRPAGSPVSAVMPADTLAKLN